MYSANTKFLVVDDFATMRKIVKKVLDELGYKNVVEAADGRLAMEIINSSLNHDPVQFIISDWNMPNMAGIDLLKACKANPTLAKLPFILVTAESEQTQIVEAAKSGVSEYVIKPFNAMTLKAKIEKVYSKHQSAEKKTA